ncbi:MAG: ATP-grasp domain-containing protein [Candidatus Thorarchaeota archaeon]|nr:ATP-grasp domain-containing protein [Candidatus Thorarchaeota archaeon]
MLVALIVNTRLGESEFEVEYDPPHTIEMIKHGIEAAGHNYIFIEADENVIENLKDVKPDLVFNRAEGLRGESRESHIPALLEMLGIPYVGANVLTTAVCLNKAWTKMILAYHGVRTAAFHVCRTVEETESLDFTFPVILKPNEEGSSVGINEDNVVRNRDGLRVKLTAMLESYEQSILIEEFIEGREFSVGILGVPGGTPEVLPILEIDFSGFPPEVMGVYGQRAKTIYEDLDHYVCPAKIPEFLKEEIEQITIDVCRHLEIPDFARIDYRMNDGGKIFFLEINPLPGMDFDLEEKDISFYPYMAMKGGYTYDQLIHRLIESARSRYGIDS